MNKTLAIALLVVGVLLLGFGINASQSAASGISKLFTGNPTNQAIWLIAGGAFAAIAGFIGLVKN
jgi:hypothetical protein